MNFDISVKDREILREKAKKQLELSMRPENLERKAQWYLHNDLKGEKPLVQLELGTFAHEIKPQRMSCEGEFARSVESALLSNYLNQEIFDDDRVTPDYFPMTYDATFRLFDVEVQIEHTKAADGQESVGHHFIPSIGDLEDDYEKLKPSYFEVDMETTARKKAAVEEAIGDILPVKIEMECLYSVPTQMLVHIMSMENMMFNMYDYPELFKEMMDRIAQDTNAYYDYLEKNRLIMPTVGHAHLGNGSMCYTTSLPGEEEFARRPFTTKDVWGFMDSQETVGISPQMFEEFIFPCYQKISERYGLLSYGCCEPVDPIWDSCLSKLHNLRKLSISPWCNEEAMGEKLRGSGIIYYRKPSPNFLGVSEELDEEALRAHIRKSLSAARGCHMEFAQRDVYTIHRNEEKARRYVQIIREEIEKNWK